MAFKLDDLAEVVVEVIIDEAQFLQKYESNWAGVYGLPGRRESHLVAALACRLRCKHGIRSVLDDSLWGCPNTRCDLAVQLDSVTEQWAWIEVKTMPVEDARDKLAMVHGDIRKLEDAARDRQNFPQAVVLIGYDDERKTLEPRFVRFAEAHGLHRWPNLGNGVRVVDLPVSPRGPQHYRHAVVGLWSRADTKALVLDCLGKCHLQ